MTFLDMVFVRVSEKLHPGTTFGNSFFVIVVGVEALRYFTYLMTRLFLPRAIAGTLNVLQFDFATLKPESTGSVGV